LGTNEFALDFRKNGLFRWVDVGIDLYERMGRIYAKSSSRYQLERFPSKACQKAVID